jgi:Reverse transcriptase (RNA-dependent DNA polymerase)
MCVDYRNLNEGTVKETYPFPLIQEIRKLLQGGRVFTTLDLKDAFNQIRIAEEDIKKTTFRTKYGNFAWKVMPFGLAKGPSIFQKFIEGVLSEQLHTTCMVYMDDIIIWGIDHEECLKRTEEVITVLEKNYLRSRLDKCKFLEEEIEYLGHRVDKDGIFVNETRREKMLKWEKPRTIKEMRQYLGYFNFCREFIPNCAMETAEMTELLKKKTKRLIWTRKADEAFENMKKKV